MTTLRECNAEVLRLLGGEHAPQSLATVMHGAWVNFVKTGCPRDGALPEWPPYDRARRPVMHLDVESRLVSDPDGETWQLWSGADY